jgi:hypothetical protein
MLVRYVLTRAQGHQRLSARDINLGAATSRSLISWPYLVALCYIGLTQGAICHIAVLVVVFPYVMAKLFARSTLTHGDLHVHA